MLWNLPHVLTLFLSLIELLISSSLSFPRSVSRCLVLTQGKMHMTKSCFGKYECFLIFLFLSCLFILSSHFPEIAYKNVENVMLFYPVLLLKLHLGLLWIVLDFSTTLNSPGPGLTFLDSTRLSSLKTHPEYQYISVLSRVYSHLMLGVLRIGSGSNVTLTKLLFCLL